MEECTDHLKTNKKICERTVKHINDDVPDAYSKDLKAIMDRKKYSKEDLVRMKAAGVSTARLAEYKTMKKYCKTQQFKRIAANRNMIVHQHLPLALYIAKLYHKSHGKKNIALADLISAANEGLMDGAQKFVGGVVPAEYKDIRFSTVAWMYIKKKILYELNMSHAELTMPERTFYQNHKDGVPPPKFYSKDADPLTNDYKEGAVYNNLSTDSMNAHEIMELAEAEKTIKTALINMYKELTKKEKDVISSLFGTNRNKVMLSNKETAKLLNLSTSTVTNTSQRAIRKMYASVSKKQRRVLVEACIIAGIDIQASLCA